MSYKNNEKGGSRDTKNVDKLISVLDLQHIQQPNRKLLNGNQHRFPKSFATDDDQIGLLDRIENTIPTGNHVAMYARP